jgi:hypothetical protein
MNTHCQMQFKGALSGSRTSIRPDAFRGPLRTSQISSKLRHTHGDGAAGKRGDKKPLGRSRRQGFRSETTREMEGDVDYSTAPVERNAGCRSALGVPGHDRDLQVGTVIDEGVYRRHKNRTCGSSRG